MHIMYTLEYVQIKHQKQGSSSKSDSCDDNSTSLSTTLAVISALEKHLSP